MAINVGEVEAYAIMIERAQRQAGANAKSSVKKWIKANPNWEVADLRAFSVSAVSATVRDFGAGVSELACNLYDTCMLNEGVTVPSAEPWTGDYDKQVLKAVRYQIAKALDGDIAGYLDAIDEMAQYYTRLSANNTTMFNVERDNKSAISGALSSKQMNQRFGALNMPTSHATRRHQSRRRSLASARRVGDIAFARVPTGLETCTYCLMLASRGFVYQSADSAGHADHRGCNCMIVPGRYQQSSIDGIDFDGLYDCWRDLETLEARAKKTPDEFGETDTERKAEVERRKQEIVGSYKNITLSTDPAEVRKHLSTGVNAWYEPREKMTRNYKG